jgi:hypothetical protein
LVFCSRHASVSGKGLSSTISLEETWLANIISPGNDFSPSLGKFNNLFCLLPQLSDAFKMIF